MVGMPEDEYDLGMRPPFEDFWRIAEDSDKPWLWWPIVTFTVGIVILCALLIGAIWFIGLTGWGA